MDALVAHYHEVGLKGRNRSFFEEALTRNLKRAMHGTGYTRVRRAHGRIIVDFAPGALVEVAAQRAARVFGVAYIGAGRRVDPEMHLLEDAAVKLLAEAPFASFAIRARRTPSRFSGSSQAINVAVGRRVQEATGARVDLTDPGATVWIELFAGEGIAYRTRLRGPGGLPAGVSGRMLVLLSGGIDSPVAAWLMGRRGAEVECIHFHGLPFTDPSSLRQATELAEKLTGYHLALTVHFVPLADAQREIVTHAPASMRTVLYRRMMMRIAALLARDRGAQALVTGDSLGQVASQTIENIATVDAAVPGVQVLRPLIGMDKLDIMDRAKDIGTFDISTRSYQDCCVLFQPRSPITRCSRGLAERAERDIDVEAAADKALAGIETQVLSLPSAAGSFG